jgi:hypothetical protein
MRKKTAKTSRNKTEVLGKSAICSNLLEIAPNIQAIRKQSSKQQVGGNSAGKLEIKESNLGESANSSVFQTEFSGKTSQALNSSGFQPKAAQIQEFAKKPQISSVPGISPRERNRYRLLMGDRILGDRLTIDEVLKLAQGGQGNG